MTAVVITGAGLITALGDRPAAVHQALVDGRTAFGPCSFFPEGTGDTRVAEVREFAPRTYLGAKNLRPLDRTGQLTAVAAELTLADSGWPPDARSAQDVGLVLGTTFCSVRTIGEFDRRAMRDGPEYASPLDFANTVINAAAGQVAIWHRLRGVNSTISAGAVSGLHAIGYAAQLIRAGRATTLLAGGAEELCFESYLGFARAGLLAAPTDSGPRPFDLRRDGCMLGEAAAFLMLEAEQTAAARGARVIGRIEGFASGYDGRDVMATARGQNALAAAVERALSAAGGAPLGAVMSSGSGSPVLDAREATALTDALDGAAARVPVSTVKGHLGETQGAGGALSTIVLLESLRTGTLPGIAGLDQPESFGLDLAVQLPRRLTAPLGLVTAVAREGNCSALVVAAASD